MRDDLEIPFFPHKLNRDGTYDSICLQCFATVATAPVSSDLDRYDLEHKCDESASREQNFLARIRSLVKSLTTA